MTILLDKDQIQDELNKQHFTLPYHLHLFQTIDSTNRYLKELPPSSNLEICIAEEQTQGRGRFGRHWHSPFGENIYLSTRWNLQCDLNKLSGLSLVISLAIVNALKEFDIADGIKIKWPNDVLWGDKKLCGSLLESVSNGLNQIIIGIGLNVNSDTHKHQLPDKSWCSLFEISRQFYNRNAIVVTLINTLYEYLYKFLQADLSLFMQEWQNLDYLEGKVITLKQGNCKFMGEACGVNKSGNLIIKDEFGLKHYVSADEITLKL